MSKPDAPEMMDRNGRLVHAFSVEMSNLGFERMADHILAMLKDGAWKEWKDGLGQVQLLAGEFDYFLSMCNVTRDTVMHGLRDVELKAKLQKAMDERRSGDQEYRRRFDEIRSVLGNQRHAVPFGYTESEGKVIAELTGDTSIPKRRDSLGEAVRRYSISGTTKKPAFPANPLDQAKKAVLKLSPSELQEFGTWLAEVSETKRS